MKLRKIDSRRLNVLFVKLLFYAVNLKENSLNDIGS